MRRTLLLAAIICTGCSDPCDFLFPQPQPGEAWIDTRRRDPFKNELQQTNYVIAVREGFVQYRYLHQKVWVTNSITQEVFVGTTRKLGLLENTQ